MNTLSSSLEQERSKNKQLKAELVKLQVCGDEGFGDVELVVWHKWIPCVCSVLFTVFAGIPRERAITTNRPINADTFFCVMILVPQLMNFVITGHLGNP